MMQDPKILWGINVYSRLNHLHLQEALIRRHFQKHVEIFVFSNHEKNKRDEIKFMEDTLHIHPINSGAHTGCQDAYNEGLQYVKSCHDFVIWSHADCIIADYSFIDETFELMLADKAAFAALQGVSHRSNPRSQFFDGEVPYVLNDLMIFKPDFYTRIFPRYEKLDGQTIGTDGSSVISPYGVEVAVGKWVIETLRSNETIHTMGDRIIDHQSAEMLGSMETSICMSNKFDKTIEFVRSKFEPEVISWLDDQNLLIKKFDDTRLGWFD